MKKLKLFISLWFTMFSMVVFGQAEYEKIAITQNTQDNTAGRLLVQDVTTGEIRWILKSILDNKFNQPTGNATQYLDGAGNPTTFPVLGQSDRVITQVRNSTGATITKGTVVYLNGATGGKPNVQKAQANAEATSSGTFGVIQSDINNNSNGYVVVIGTVLGLNTSAYSEGQVLWLSPTTAGGFTTTKPVAPNHAVYVGIVTLAATQGTIEVKIQNGYELDEIHDVLITSKTDNDGLIYESSSGLWKNKQITKAMVGLANVDNTSDLNKPISTATQTALNLKENTANKNTANGYAGLGSDGKLISSQLPAITITDTFVVGSQAAMLALTAETGDVAVRTDVNKSFILKGSSAGTLADWQELLTPTSSVTSVFGRQGAVTANSGDYTTAQVTETTNKKYQTDNQALYNDATSSIQNQIDSKEPYISPTGTNGSYWRGTKTWATLDTSVVPENGPLFFTNARARSAVSLTTTGTSGAATYSSSTGILNIPNYATGVGGSGTTNYISKFTAASTLGNSVIFDDGTNLGLGTTTPLTGGGTAKWITANGTAAYSGGFIGSISGAAKMYLYSESGFAKLQGTTGEGVRLDVNGGTAALTALSSGNVGIGTVSPAEKLSVSGAIISTGAITGHGANRTTLSQEGANGAYWQSYGADASTVGTFNLRQATSDFSTNRIALHINSSGNAGIGTASPSEKLEVQNGTAGAKIKVSNTGGGSASLEISSNASSVASLNFTNSLSLNGGNVGIGMESPTQKLDVRNAQSTPTTGFGIRTWDQVPPQIYVQSNTQAIGAGGAIGFGSKDPSSTNYLTWRIRSAFSAQGSGFGANQGLLFDTTTDGTSSSNMINALTLLANGNATFGGSVTATGFFQSSDLRLKDIISRDGDVIKYKWKDKRDDKIHIGYVAQEVQKENPDQVNTDEKGILSVNYIEILVQKIKDLENRIKQLEK